MGFIVITSNYLVQFPVKFYELENLLTYGAFSYPITFLITDLANRAFGKKNCKIRCSDRFLYRNNFNIICLNKF